ncbi:MAG: hypothetical protein JKY37_34955 [Nannocystaceae bacterium]|nr:hypothetical protein [Nannocystaceae bacterium]
MRCYGSIVLLMASSIAACTANPSGPEHWRAACERVVPSPSPGVPDHDVAQCEATFRSYPAAVADDVARCALRGLATGVPEVACYSKETHAHFDAVQRTQAQLGRVRKIARDRMGDGRAFPDVIAGLVGDADELDAWSTAIRVRPDGDDVEISSAGADRRFGTADDLIAGPDFIYFQF